MSVPVSLRRSSRLRFSERPDSNLVPLLNSDLLERQGVVSPPDGCGRPELPARRQLLSVDRRLADGATADGPATQGRVAALRDGIARTWNPIHDEIFEARPTQYYWSTYQSEWAIDISFRTPEQLRRLYPRLLQHAITTFGSADVMRFLGRHMPLNGELPKRFTGEVVSDLRQREEGVRIKHRLNDNSVKLYDKSFTELVCLMRAEATVNSVKAFRVI